MKKFDFSGWATKNDLRCADGRTIRKDAFKDDDGHTVPLVWQHQHDNPENVLGHALLENRNEGVYAYCTFNNSKYADHVRELIKHGDISSLSIYANKLQQVGGDVLHGCIREVSVVLAGANPGAVIDNAVLAHGEESESEAFIYTGESISHADDEDNKPEEKKEEPKMADSEKTVKDVFDSLTEEQKNVVYYMIGAALDSRDDNDDEGEESMKQNVFEQDTTENTLSHDEIGEILGDAKRYGSLKESVLAHGITNIDFLFPDPKNLTNAPEWFKREDAWVSKVMNGTHHTPFSRVKSMYANITADEARAKGYLKGHQKVEEVFPVLKRTTPPTTIYKKQKLDRDDVIDITDFDVVAWLKSEMRVMLDEEIARAILIGDGRNPSSDDHINDQCIRPIWTDDDVYTIKVGITYPNNATDDAKAKLFIRNAIKSRKEYKGSGNPVLFITEDSLTDMLLMEDNMGRVIYETADKLKTALRVSDIVTVPVMENQTRTVAGTGTDLGKTFKHTLLGILVNLGDYNVGADKGGAVSMFDDFDIDYNQQKYLIETRCSGALVRPKSAIAIEAVEEVTGE